MLNSSSMNRITHKPKAYARRLRILYNSLYFGPLVVFFALLLLTYGAWQSSRTTLRNDTRSALSDHISRVEDNINQRLAAYEQIITGGAGLVRGSQDVTKNEWHDYVSTFDIARYNPGVQGIGLIKVFGAAQLPDVMSYMQAQGVTDFHITPDTPRDFYTAVLYAEPPNTGNAAGIDMFTQTGRMQTMLRARDSGQPSITPPVKSFRNLTAQPVLVLFVPIYDSSTSLATIAQRQQALRGFTYAGLGATDFFNAILAQTQQDDTMALQITSLTNAGPSALIYQSDKYEQFVHAHDYTFSDQTMSVYGQSWKLRYGFKNSALIRPQRALAPILTLLAGFLFSLLLAEVIYLLLKARNRDFSQQKEQAVDLAKDELLSLASHQLRTPATTVKQYLGMVLQGFAGDITETQHSLLDKAYTGNERQLYIINEMLHIAKIDAGRIVLARHKTDIVKLVRDILFEAQPSIEEAGHTLRESLPKQPVYIHVDEHMLRMAIENLVSNAVKYTPSGGKIRVEVHKDKGEIRIVVSDNGVGIEQKDFSKLYKLFTRLDNKLMQNVSGTGVGLYLAKHLIELHKGTLTLSSKPGKGSAFTITLPINQKTRKPL